jgi:hypothetical protein
MDSGVLQQSRCKQQITWKISWKSISQYIRAMAASSAANRYTPSNNGSNQVPQTQSVSQAQVAQSNIHGQRDPYQLGNVLISQQNVPRPNTVTTSTKFSILFGVQGPRPALETSLIPVELKTTDSNFYRLLKQHYRANRGRLRLWFSIWTFGSCEVVKVP